MTYTSLAACLALTVFAAANAIVSLLAVLVWRAAERDLDRVRSDARAAGLLLLRFLPVMAATVFALGVFLPAFHAFEPRDTTESVGPLMLAASVAALVIVATALARGWRAVGATDRLVRAWLCQARPLDLPGLGLRAYRIPVAFPVVSLVGIVRPRLFVSDRVLEACTPDEVAAMVGHEWGHLVARDNLKRLALHACPDLLAWLPAGRAIERHWHEAAEESADDWTARGGRASAFALANALLKVARLTPEAPPRLPLLSWLYSGDGFERRVRRLLANAPAGSTSCGWLLMTRGLALVPLVFAALVLIDPSLLRTVHALIETVVRAL